jgi:capsular polysaccharide export protein
MQGEKRSFLFLQGPLSPFFRRLGEALSEAGCSVNRINFCGGDVFYWPCGNTHWWQGHMYEWPLWVAELMEKYKITDIVLMGDWRPLHREAIWLARQKGNRIWVFEEGYLRPGYITMEEGGVNAYSSLPRTPEAVHQMAEKIDETLLPVPSEAPNPMIGRVLKTAWYHIGNVILWPFFHRYKTHRPYTIGRELTGHIPRYLNRRKRRRHGLEVTKALIKGKIPFYLMPLQLDADSQVRRHSPFTGMLECMAMVITNFARNAPPGSFLVFKNHPLDNGLRNYRRYMRSLGRATGCSERLRFVEEVRAEQLCRKAKGLVLCNSTIGMTALSMNKPVFCVGESIYAMPGLAVNEHQMPLAEFWNKLPPPDENLVKEFFSVLRYKALIPGNFYSPEGIREAVKASLVRMELNQGDIND